MEAQKKFAEQAKKKVLTFLPSIDPALTVSIENEKKPDRPERIVLHFAHTKNPAIHWNIVPFMEDGESWLNNLEDSVRRIYEEQKSQA